MVLQFFSIYFCSTSLSLADTRWVWSTKLSLCYSFPKSVALSIILAKKISANKIWEHWNQTKGCWVQMQVDFPLCYAASIKFCLRYCWRNKSCARFFNSPFLHHSKMFKELISSQRVFFRLFCFFLSQNQSPKNIRFRQKSADAQKLLNGGNKVLGSICCLAKWCDSDRIRN